VITQLVAVGIVVVVVVMPSIVVKESKSIHMVTFIVSILSNRSDVDHTVLPANCTMPAFPCKRSPDGATPK